MKFRGKSIALVAAGIVIGSTVTGPAASAAAEILAQHSTMPFFVNGMPVEVEAYLIHGNNYLKLRDIAALADFGVTWSAESGSVLIDTMVGYDGAYKAPVKTVTQMEETEPVTLTAYHKQANAAVFDTIYTADAYDALRECMAEGKSTEIAMSAATRAAIQGVCAAIGTYPSYELIATADGKAHFQRKQSSAYADAAEYGRQFVGGLSGSESDKLYAIACLVCDRLTYDANSTATPRVLFASDSVKKGNCMSYAHGFQFLCDLAGIPCVLVHSDIHQWNEVYTGGRWYCVDLTSFDLLYTDTGSARLLGHHSELQCDIYTQSEPRLTQFAKELLVPGSTR